MNWIKSLSMKRAGVFACAGNDESGHDGGPPHTSAHEQEGHWKCCHLLWSLCYLNKRHVTYEPNYLKKKDIRAGKLTHGFHCHLNYVASVDCGADDGLDFGDVASFVAVLSQRSSCAPSVGDHTFWDFWLLRRSPIAVPQLLLQTGRRPKKPSNKKHKSIASLQNTKTKHTSKERKCKYKRNNLSYLQRAMPLNLFHWFASSVICLQTGLWSRCWNSPTHQYILLAQPITESPEVARTRFNATARDFTDRCRIYLQTEKSKSTGLLANMLLI